MKRRKNKTIFIFLLFITFSLSMILGYAFLTTNLNIVGTTVLKDNKWDIHLENAQVLPGSIQASIPIIDTNKTTLTYSITLNKPGDYYDFTVDAKNAGTIDGMIESISNKLNGIEITTLPNALEYNISYLDGTEIENNQILEAGEKETIHITIIYKTNIDDSDLPSTEETLNFTFTITYIQADNNALQSFRPNIVYTANIFENPPIDKTVYKNQAISNSIIQYQTASEAKSFLTQNAGRNIPFCLKHYVENNLVTESFIEFTITNEMTQSNNGAIPGTYTILSGGSTYDEIDQLFNDDSINYERNLITIERAFGKENCYNNIDLTGLKKTCKIDTIEIEVHLNGDIRIKSYEYDFTEMYYLSCLVINDSEYGTRASCGYSSR